MPFISLWRTDFYFTVGPWNNLFPHHAVPESLCFFPANLPTKRKHSSSPFSEDASLSWCEIKEWPESLHSPPSCELSGCVSLFRGSLQNISFVDVLLFVLVSVFVSFFFLMVSFSLSERLAWVLCAKSNPPQQGVVRQVLKQIWSRQIEERFSFVNGESNTLLFLLFKAFQYWRVSHRLVLLFGSASEQVDNLDSVLDYSVPCLSLQHKPTLTEEDIYKPSASDAIKRDW